jgi:cysteine desulfuration protein SufE
MTIDEIRENFAFLDDWEDRYRYLIELGRTLEPLAPEAHSAGNKVEGCASQVWLQTTIDRSDPATPVLSFVGDSDAHIVRGLIAVLLAVYSGKAAREIVDHPAEPVFEELGLKSHLSAQRANGLASMRKRIERDAAGALAEANVTP